jgi:hypothetical protein
MPMYLQHCKSNRPPADAEHIGTFPVRAEAMTTTLRVLGRGGKITSSSYVLWGCKMYQTSRFGSLLLTGIMVSKQGKE